MKKYPFELFPKLLLIEQLLSEFLSRFSRGFPRNLHPVLV